MAYLMMKPAAMVLLVAVAVMLVSQVAATSGSSSGGDDNQSGKGGSSPGHGGSSPPSSPGHSSPPSSPGYGSPPSSTGHGSPPSSPGYGSPPSSPGYGSPPSSTGHGSPPSSPGYGSPPSSTGHSSPPSSPGHSSPPSSPGYGSPPSSPGHSSPPSSPGHSSPPSSPGYGSPPSSPGHGSPPSSPGYGNPPSSPGHGGGKPDCKKKGGMCGDPKIVGGDGVVFYFHGRMDRDFCLVSDSDVHINAHFIGKRPEGRQRDFTWVQALGFVFGKHSLTIAAKPVATWDSKVDQLELSYNGIPFALDASSWASPDGAMTLNRIGAANAVDLVIQEKMGVALTVVPISKEENRVHKYGIGADDCFAHLDMQFRFYNLSSSVNGVLGQTYQPGFVNPVKRGVAMPIMGGAERFSSSSLLATDCKMSQYTAQAIALGSAMPSFMAVCGSSGLPGACPAASPADDDEMNEWCARCAAAVAV